MNQAPKEQQQALGIKLNRWGGNPSTRYNWKLSNAWNAGRDYFYRNGDYGYTGSSAAGATDKANHDGQDFLPWFLDEMRWHDQQAGVRTLDVLDVHYYPEGLYNDDDDVDPATAAHRLRSTRSL
jgi:hypothetical protein